jgi:hypothetical protein
MQRRLRFALRSTLKKWQKVAHGEGVFWDIIGFEGVGNPGSGPEPVYGKARGCQSKTTRVSRTPIRDSEFGECCA